MSAWLGLRRDRGDEAFFLDAMSGKETLHGWVYVEAFFLEAMSGKKKARTDSVLKSPIVYVPAEDGGHFT